MGRRFLNALQTDCHIADYSLFSRFTLHLYIAGFAYEIHSVFKYFSVQLEKTGNKGLLKLFRITMIFVDFY